MAVEFVDNENFERITSEGVWLVDFYSDHCGPCKLLDVVIKEILGDSPDLNWGKCNIEFDSAFDLFNRLKIVGTPTLLIYVDGELKGQFMGAKTREFVEAEISRCMYGE